jgi:hypothetical protein
MPSPARTTSTAPVELRWQIWLPWLALAGVLVSATRTDPDLWGHVRFGLDWLGTRELPVQDPYSYTQDRPWVNHEWLSEAATGAAYQLGGTGGLVTLKSLVMAGAITVIARRMRGASPIMSAAVMTVAIVGALPLSGTVRPQIWSALCLALLVPLLTLEPPTPARVGAAVVLFGAWANLHGGWITGGAVLALHVVIRMIRAPHQALAWLGLGAGSLLATLCNPYGAGLWRFLSTTVRPSRPDITEWRPFSLHEPAIMWVSIVGTLLALLLVMRRRETRPPIETTAVVLLLVIAGLRVSRVAPLMCPAAIALLAPWIRAVFGTAGRLTAPTSAAAAVLLVPAALAVAAARTPVSQAMNCLAIKDVWMPDLAAAAQLKGLSGNLWTTFDWGEYAIWHFGPTLRVSIDGRRETVYSDTMIDLHRAAEYGDAQALERITAFGTDYVWLPSTRIAARTWLEQHGYRVDLAMGASFVARRTALPRIGGGQPPFAACFP